MSANCNAAVLGQDSTQRRGVGTWAPCLHSGVALVMPRGMTGTIISISAQRAAWQIFSLVAYTNNVHD